MVQLGERACATATAASQHATALGKPLDLPEGFPIEVSNDVSGGARVESSALGGPRRIVIARPLSAENGPLLTFTLGHEMGHVVHRHGTWKKLIEYFVNIASALCVFLLGAATYLNRDLAKARRTAAIWIVLFLSAACLFWLLRAKSIAYEVEADTFGIYTLVESGQALPEGTAAIAALFDSLRHASDPWWRGIDAHPAPAIRAANIRALR